jgi:hypothetical protein
VEDDEIAHEQQRGCEQRQTAGQRDNDQRSPARNDRIGIVEIGDAPPLALQAQPMPGQRHHHHADEP